MDFVARIAGVFAGALAGWAYGALLARVVSTKRPAWFWVAGAGALLVGVGAAATGMLLGSTPVAWGAFAFAGVALTALKWRSGKVPGVPARVPEDD